MGSRAYSNLIDELEGEEEIFERLAFTGAETIVDDLHDREKYVTEIDDDGEQEGFQLIHGLLEQKGKLKILAHCRNLIGAMTGYDVEKGKTDNRHPWKPCVDALRLMAQCELGGEELEPQIVRARGY